MGPCNLQTKAAAAPATAAAALPPTLKLGSLRARLCPGPLKASSNLLETACGDKFDTPSAGGSMQHTICVTRSKSAETLL